MSHRCQQARAQPVLMTETLASPCVGVCQLDAAQRCLGCGRTLDEIAEWPLASSERQRSIVEAARLRLKQLHTSAPKA